jgi:polysaccharide export outer membrane protein
LLASGISAYCQTIQPGDTIDISVWQDPKLDRRITVPKDGTIAFPLAGHLKAGGLTLPALENALRDKLKANYTDRLDITVSLVPSAADQKQDDALAPRFYVTGEVKTPGPHLLKIRTTVMQAISLAGGFGAFAAKQRIQVRRKENGVEKLFVFDYNAYESGRDFNANIDLRSGDVVIVPERGLLD